MEKIALFPGSFDPITRGHESIILRASILFDKIIIGIGQNDEKKAFFPIEQRLQWVKDTFQNVTSIEVVTYKGLTIDFCKTNNIDFILRGLRTSADFEFERSIGQMNKKMHPGIETIFLLTTPEHTALNSSIVREIIRNGGDPGPFIPAAIKIETQNRK